MDESVKDWKTGEPAASDEFNEDKPKKKRGRPPKKKAEDPKEAEPTETSEPEEDSEPVEEEVPAREVDDEELMDATQKAAAKIKPANVKKIMAEFGAARVGEIAPEKRAAYIAKLEQAVKVV